MAGQIVYRKMTQEEGMGELVEYFVVIAVVGADLNVCHTRLTMDEIKMLADTAGAELKEFTG